MRDWSKDPVFGDFALRFAPRGMHGPRAAWVFSGLRQVTLGGSIMELADADRAALAAFIHAKFQTLHGARADIAASGADELVRACVLAASDNTQATPAPAKVMGIVNVTPDSFSDGGQHLDASRAIEHGLALARDGADMLDVGGESTRPGAEPVDEVEELRRVFPVVCGLAERTSVPISIDTTKAKVAGECLAAGASIVNDVSAGRGDPDMFGVVTLHGAGLVAMHRLGTPRDMQRDPQYPDVTGAVTEFLRARCRAALDAGVKRERLWIDPGIGFGKTLEHNLTLLRELSQLRSLGLPLVLGVSRKSFVAALEEREGRPHSEAGDRLGGTLAALTIGVQHGAEILRVHDVRAAKQAALVARTLASWNSPSCGA